MEKAICSYCGTEAHLISCEDVAPAPGNEDSKLYQFLKSQGYLYCVWGGYWHGDGAENIDGMTLWFKSKPFEGSVCMTCFWRNCYRSNCRISYYMFGGEAPAVFEEQARHDRKRFPGATLEWSFQKLWLDDAAEFSKRKLAKELKRMSGRDRKSFLKMKGYNDHINDTILAQQEADALARMAGEAA